MRKFLNILVIVIAAGLGIGYFTVGPSFFLGGPKISDIVTVTREVMVATAPGPAEAEAAKTATLTPKGLCSANDDGSHACIVEIAVEGAAPQTFVAVMRKSDTGAWVAVQ